MKGEEDKHYLLYISSWIQETQDKSIQSHFYSSLPSSLFITWLPPAVIVENLLSIPVRSAMDCNFHCYIITEIFSWEDSWRNWNGSRNLGWLGTLYPILHFTENRTGVFWFLILCCYYWIFLKENSLRNNIKGNLKINICSVIHS